MTIDPNKCWTTGAPPQPAPYDDDIAEHGSLLAFQIHVCRILAAWLPLAPIANQRRAGAITYADKKTVLSDVVTSLRSIGVSMVITLESGKRNSSLLHSVTFDPITYGVRIAEAPKTNRGPTGTNMSATAVAEQVMLCLSGLRLANGLSKLDSFIMGGEEGDLQTAELTFSTAYAITPPASLLTE